MMDAKGTSWLSGGLDPLSLKKVSEKECIDCQTVQLVESSEKYVMVAGKYDAFLTCSYNYV